MQFSRRRALGAVASVAAAAYVRYPAGAAQYTFKYANDNALAHPMTQAALWWAQRVHQDTNGQIEIQTFPNSILGSDPAMLSQLRVGALQFMSCSGDILSAIVPAASIDGVAFAFQKFDDPWKAMDGGLGALIRADAEKGGVHVFNRMYDAGLRVFTNDIRPINSPADMKGMKMRCPPSKIVVQMIADFGATPVSLSIAEVYSALQTHIVDGTENDILNVYNLKMFEVQKYLTLAHQRWAGFWLIANPETWRQIPPKLQDVISHAYDDSVTRERVDSIKLQNGLRAKLEAVGMKVNVPNPAPFRAALQAAGYYSNWKKEYGETAWSLLEKYTGTLA